MQWKPNVTVAAIIQKNNLFLLVEENIDGRIVFNQPAGHLENNESLTNAVIREVLEETAGHFQPHGLCGIYLHKNIINGISYLRFCYFGECNYFEKERPLDPGIIRTVWMTKKEIEDKNSQLRTPIVLHCIDDFLSGQRMSLDVLKNFI